MTLKYKKANLNINDIALYFIKKGISENRPMSNKKLQKLLYYSQAWSLVLNKKILFNDPIEAWVHGPAIRSIYKKYKEFGFNPIVSDALKNCKLNLDKETLELLDEVWRVYGQYDAQYLELLTHSEKPWQEARKNLEYNDISDQVISIDSMFNYYSVLKNAHSQKEA